MNIATVDNQKLSSGNDRDIRKRIACQVTESDRGGRPPQRDGGDRGDSAIRIFKDR